MEATDDNFLWVHLFNCDNEIAIALEMTKEYSVIEHCYKYNFLLPDRRIHVSEDGLILLWFGFAARSQMNPS